MRTMKTLAPASLVLAAVLLPRPGQAQTCTGDADCAQGMVCHSETIGKCSGGATKPCAPNTVCDPTPVPPPTCTQTTVSQCTYRWQLPCNADADCGSGFVCQPSVTGTCSGSAGTGTAGPATTSGSNGSSGATSGVGGGAGGVGVPVPVPPPAILVDAGVGTCSTSTSFPGSCRPQVSTCNSDADCPAPWTCVAAGSPIGIGSPLPSPIDAPVVALPPDQPVSTATATGTAITPPAVKACRSPFDSPTRGGGLEGGQPTVGLVVDAGATKGGSSPLPPTPAVDLPTGVDGGVSNGMTPTLPPNPSLPTSNGGAGDTVGGTTTTSATTGGGGCSVASGGLPGASIVIVGLCAALGLLARRRQGR